MSIATHVLIPAAGNLLALCLMVGIYQNHLRHEVLSDDLERFVRRLGLLHMAIVEGALALVLLSNGQPLAVVLRTIAATLVGSAAIATASLSGTPPIERRRAHRLPTGPRTSP